MESDAAQRATDATLTEAHVVRILRLDESRGDWGGGLALRPGGVYRRAWTDDELRLLSADEFAAVVGTGRGRLLLALPCTLDEFAEFVAAEHLLDPFIARRLHLLRVMFGRRGAAAPTARDHAAATKVHRIGRDLLAPVIDQARRAVADGSDSAAVMAELERLARLPDAQRPAPLAGVNSGGIQWRDGGAVKTLTRKALTMRLQRHAQSRRVTPGLVGSHR